MPESVRHHIVEDMDEFLSVMNQLFVRIRSQGGDGKSARSEAGRRAK
jgi:hypothetical protein